MVRGEEIRYFHAKNQAEKERMSFMAFSFDVNCWDLIYSFLSVDRISVSVRLGQVETQTAVKTLNKVRNSLLINIEFVRHELLVARL